MTRRSSGRSPAAAAGELATMRSTYGGVRVTTSGTSTMPRAASDSGFAGRSTSFSFGWREPAGEDVFDRGGEGGDGQGVVEPGVGEAAAEFFAEHAEEPALRIGERAAGGAGVVGGGVDDIHIAVKVGREGAAASFQRGDGGNDAVQDADGFFAGGDAEQIAEGEHACAGVGGDGGREVEVRHIVAARVEFEHGDFGERVGGDLLGREVAAVVEDDGHFIGIEDVTRDGEHVAFAGDQDAALVVLKTADAAGAVDLHDLGLHLAGDLGERRRAVAGPRDARPGEEASDCSRNGADVFPEFRISDFGFRIAENPNPQSAIRNLLAGAITVSLPSLRASCRRSNRTTRS